MKQLTQQLKSGSMEILEVPFPTLGSGQVLIHNQYSVISSGTEGKTVSDARKGYIAKARSRQKEVKMVIDMIKTEGLKNTYDLVMNKLEAPSPLGYSCAGVVIGVGDGVNDIKVGDRVACGGDGAYHSEIVAVNRNLCVKVSDNVELSHAAFTTIAAIAIQGIRQTDLRFGENCTVVGLGLIGLITIQVLKAAGIKAVGVDVDSVQVLKAKENGADLSLLRSDEGIISRINDFTHGYGTDAVIITAGTNSLDPIEFAGQVCRKKGKVVVVGSVPTGFSRANYYRKELDLRMSSSYGPGRYDVNYEEKGIDYPIGYVRFTENRNMQSYIDLLESNKLDIKKLISHTFSLEDAHLAYDIILSKTEHVSGILIKYDQNEIQEHSVVLRNTISDINAVNVGLIGAGSFAQNVVLPSIKGYCSFVGVVTGHGNMSRYIADKYGFNYCTDNVQQIIEDSNIGTVFILTRHNTHAEYTIKALQAGKNVVVEKPLVMNFEQLEEVKEVYSKAGKGLMLGFNRRFSPLTLKLVELFTPEQKKAINIRVNAGVLPFDHWVHDPDVGGGRIVGEVCHFIDLACYIAGAKANSIHAISMGADPAIKDTVTINIDFNNGSIANINYYSNGNKNIQKERIEVFCNGVVCLIDDFKRMDIISERGKRTVSLKTQDKGHLAQFRLVTESLAKGKPFPISFDSIYHSSLLTLEAIRSITESRVIKIC